MQIAELCPATASAVTVPLLNAPTIGVSANFAVRPPIWTQTARASVSSVVVVQAAAVSALLSSNALQKVRVRPPMPVADQSLANNVWCETRLLAAAVARAIAPACLSSCVAAASAAWSAAF